MTGSQYDTRKKKEKTLHGEYIVDEIYQGEPLILLMQQTIHSIKLRTIQ